MVPSNAHHSAIHHLLHPSKVRDIGCFACQKEREDVEDHFIRQPPKHIRHFDKKERKKTSTEKSFVFEV